MSASTDGYLRLVMKAVADVLHPSAASRSGGRGASRGRHEMPRLGLSLSPEVGNNDYLAGEVAARRRSGLK